MGMIKDMEKATEVAKRLLAKEEVPVSEILTSAQNLSTVSFMMVIEVVNNFNRKAA